MIDVIICEKVRNGGTWNIKTSQWPAMVRNMTVQLRIFPKLGLPTTDASFQPVGENQETKVFSHWTIKKKNKRQKKAKKALLSAIRALTLVLACSG